jgi:hypothetical protein
MPSYFDGYEIVGQTKNFLVTCDNNSEARFRAQNVAAVCEGDLAKLNDLFSTNFEAGNTSDHTIWVHALTDQQSAAANGWNYGYETDESSRILLQRAFIPPPPTPPPPDPPITAPPNYGVAVVEFPRFVFVAELAEILMEFTGYGWYPGNSMGEGLSNLVGALLHPAGYYTTNAGPRINQWLNGGAGHPPRFDFVANTEGTDQDIFSYGCAILFINYLVYQLGRPLKDVIRAGGGSLAETYARLTGQPAASAYAGFNALLQKHIGNNTANQMKLDNIFPLYDPDHRRVQLTLGDPINKGISTDQPPVEFQVKPGLLCPAADFGFTRQHEQLEQPIYARAIGTANAAVRWSINGVDVPVRNSWTNVTINTPLTVNNPDRTTNTVANAVTLQYGILDAWNASVLYLKTLTTNGNCSLDVSAAAKEADVNDAETSTTESASLDTIQWLPPDDLIKQRKRCNPFYATVDKSIWGLSEELSNFKNRPDPPSERAVLQIVEAVHELDKAIAQYAEAGNVTVAEVWNQVRQGQGLRSAYAPPAGPDLTKLQPHQPQQTYSQTDQEQIDTNGVTAYPSASSASAG